MANDEQHTSYFFVIFNLKSALWVYGEYAKLRKKREK
jgi:hypothetical protein